MENKNSDKRHTRIHRLYEAVHNDTHIDGLIEMVQNELKENQPYIEKRLNLFRDEYFKRFPKPTSFDSFDDAFLKGSSFELGQLYSLLLFQNVLALFALNLNMSAIIELNGALERTAIECLENYISLGRKHGIGERLLNTRTLPDFADILFELGVWNKTQVKFAKKISKIRNGFAHKNPKFAQKLIQSNTKPVFFEMSLALPFISETETLEHILQSVPLLARLGLFAHVSEILSKKSRTEEDEKYLTRCMPKLNLREKM